MQAGLATIRYFLAALVHSGFRKRTLGILLLAMRAFADGVLTDFDPHFGQIDWASIANSQGTVARIVPTKPKDQINSLNDDLFIATLCNWLAPKRILEIGTFLGATTRLLLLNSDFGQILTVDLPSDKVITSETTDRSLATAALALGANRPYLPFSTRVRMIFADSTSSNWTEWVDGPVDLVVIDGSHSLSHAISDTARALKVLSDRGAIAWHDVQYRSYGYYLWGYRVRDAILTVLTQDQLAHVYKALGTSYAFYWPKFATEFREAFSS